MATRKYGSVDEMIAALPKDERVIVNRLRALVAECLPKAEEKVYYDWGVPFYKRNRLICFIWPNPPKGVTLGFQYGNLMSNEDGALLSEGRKQVYVLYIKASKDIDENQIRALLYEASMIDDEFGRKRRSHSKNRRRQ